MPIIMKNLIKIFVILIILFSLQFCNRDNLSNITEIVIDTSKKNALVDEEINFTAIANNGGDVIDQTTFYVNDMAISEHSYRPNLVGTYTIKGVYKDIESNLLEIHVNAPTGYSQKILVEDYTGVWCGYCPRVAYSIQQIQANQEYTARLIPVAIHLYENNDPYYCADSGALKDAFQISGLPQGRINRTVVWTSPQENNLDQVTSLIGDSAPLGIAIETSVSNNTLNASIRVGFTQDFTNLGLVVYLLENGLIHNQTNYTSFFGGDYTLVDFEHNDVLRKVYTNIYGDAIPNTESVTDNLYQFDLQEALPSNIENQENLTLVVFVVDKNTNTVINSQHVELVEDQGFD